MVCSKTKEETLDDLSKWTTPWYDEAETIAENVVPPCQGVGKISRLTLRHTDN